MKCIGVCDSRQKYGDRVAPIDSARAAGLSYVTDSATGLSRRRSGRGFRYLDPDGRPVRDADTLRRIASLAIPPAWSEVWISPGPESHLQATGRDERGRKQYRYHPRWRAERDGSKFHRMIAFGRALPSIRAAAERDLGARGLPRRKVLAVVIRLLETTLIRVGNDEYARSNRSYGLTTLLDRHMSSEGGPSDFSSRARAGSDTRSSCTTDGLRGSSANARTCPARNSSSISMRRGWSGISARPM
jgi:DNA topoisomerase-1